MTGLILEIFGLEKNDYVLHFYVERDRAVSFTKDELTRVYLEDGVHYYALIDTGLTGRGHIMCRAEIVDHEASWENKARPVVLTGYTGYDAGVCHGEGRTVACDGYRMSFARVTDIPRNIGTRVFCGVIDKWVTGYEYIDTTMIEGLKDYPVEKGVIEVDVKEGQRLVVAVPHDAWLIACKDNGLGGQMLFSNSIMGANGEIDLMINDIKYNIYGEFVTTDGKLKIYIL